VCQALGEGNGATIYRDKTYTGRVSGREIKVEVSFEAQLLGARILGLVECKCYKSRVEVSDVEEFHSKLDDIGAHKGIMFTTVGYEAGAVKVARGRGVGLFVLREGQEPSEIRVETRAAGSRKQGLLRGNFRPWGRFSEPRDDAGFRVESADEMFYILAFSMVEVLDDLARKQRSE
jgi:restriction system protein